MGDSPGLLAECRAVAASPKLCRVAQIAVAMSDDDRADLEAALADRPVLRHGGISGHTLAMVLTRRGFPVSQSAIDNHRSGRCPCGTTR